MIMIMIMIMIIIMIMIMIMIEGSLEAKLPTIWRNENAGQLGRSSEM